MRLVRVWNSKLERLVHSILVFILQFSFEVMEFVRDLEMYGDFLIIRTKALRLIVWNIRSETSVMTRHETSNDFLVHTNLLYTATVTSLRCFDLNTGKEVVLPQEIPLPTQLLLHKNQVWCKGAQPAIWNVSTNEVT